MNPFVKMYLMFSAMGMMILVGRVVYTKVGMPVIANLLSAFISASAAVEFGWVMVAVHNRKAFEFCGPLVLVSLVGCWFFTKTLVKMSVRWKIGNRR